MSTDYSTVWSRSELIVVILQGSCEIDQGFNAYPVKSGSFIRQVEMENLEIKDRNPYAALFSIVQKHLIAAFR